MLGARSYIKAKIPLARETQPTQKLLGDGGAGNRKLLNAAPDEILNPTAQRLLGDGGVQERINAGRLLNAAPDEISNLTSVRGQIETVPIQETSIQARNLSQIGSQNNIKGNVFENLIASRFPRIGRHPFFRPVRRGGLDVVSLEEGNVVINEAKFAERLQFDDFTAITKNLRSNISEVIQSLSGRKGLTRADKLLIRQPLTEFLDNRAVPANLRIRVVTGKTSVGSKLQNKIRNNTEGIPVEFEEF